MTDQITALETDTTWSCIFKPRDLVCHYPLPTMCKCACSSPVIFHILHFPVLQCSLVIFQVPHLPGIIL